MIDLERQHQDLHHISSVGVTTHFQSHSLGLKKSKQFNQSDIAIDTVVLTLMLSINRPLEFAGKRRTVLFCKVSEHLKCL